MKDRIEIGEYARTKEGIIDKVDKIIGMIENTVHLEKSIWTDIKDIVKHSKNIIDLIEKDDIVNGYRVTKIIIETDLKTKEETRHLFSNTEETRNENLIIKHTDNEIKIGTEYEPIKTILTKEQFIQNCYEVEE